MGEISVGNLMITFHRGADRIACFIGVHTKEHENIYLQGKYVEFDVVVIFTGSNELHQIIFYKLLSFFR